MRVRVYAYVVADLLHLGHLRALQQAKSLGDYLIVGVLTDEAIMEKKTKPAMSFDERFDLVRSLKWVDVVVPQHTYSPLKTVKELKPDILIESSDHKEQPANKFMQTIGGRVLIMPYYPNHSSAKIKNKIRNRA